MDLDILNISTTVSLTTQQLVKLAKNSPMLQAKLRFNDNENINGGYCLDQNQNQINLPVSVTNETANNIISILEGRNYILLGDEWLACFLVIRYLMPTYNEVWRHFWHLVEASHSIYLSKLTKFNNQPTDYYHPDNVYLFLLELLHDTNQSQDFILTDYENFYPIFKKRDLTNPGLLIRGIIEIIQKDINLLEPDQELIFNSLAMYFPDEAIILDNPLYGFLDQT